MKKSLKRATAEILKVLPREKMSHAIGKLADWNTPRWLNVKPLHEVAIQTFCKVYGVNLDEALIPEEGFRSFNDFFTRKLKSGVRPIDSNSNHIVSPADGSLEDIGFIDSGEFLVKGQTYRIEDLLDQKVEESTFDSFFTVYLSPKDYHRVHAPVSGVIKEIRHIEGNLFPVNSIGVDYIPQLFVRNERVIFVQENNRFGEVITIMVGAMIVGKMSVFMESGLKTMSPTIQAQVKPNEMVEKGAEIGIFSIGSTAIVLFPSHPTLDFQAKEGQIVKMGQKIAAMG